MPDSRKRKPLLLDLYSCAGGAARGYYDAGFNVLCVDIEPQPNNPFDFVQYDAIDALGILLDGGNISNADNFWNLTEFDAIHASPPCQAHSTLRHVSGNEYPDLIEATRTEIQATGLPYVIENVIGAPLHNPVMLCGSMFGLGANGRQLRRHRLFECSFPVLTPTCAHEGQPIGVYGTGGGGQMTRGYKGTPDEYRECMGIDWATRAEIAQAIPPMYTAFIGEHLMREIRSRREQVAA